MLLKIANLSSSSYYYQCEVLSKDDKDWELKQAIVKIYNEHKGYYGYRRITLELKKTFRNVNHKAVQRVMQLLGLKAIIRLRRRKYNSYKGDVGRIAPNLLERNFNANRVNEKWVTDVTEFKVNDRKLYLSPLMDLYNREIISYQLQEKPIFSLVDNMLELGFKRLNKGDKPILHSDQGWQYQMKRYRDKLANNQVRQSMSRKGNCLDNAVIENFFGILKCECFYSQKFDSISELKEAIHAYIYYYNNKRIKVKLKGLSPIQYRTQS